jgi:hypothetical protein
MKTNNIIKALSITFVLLIFLSACQTEQSLKRDIANLMAKDVKNYTKKAIDVVSFGVGSRVINSMIDDKMQDSLVLNNFIVYVKEDLETVKDKKMLREYKKNAKTRNLFLFNSIVKNSPEIKRDIEARFRFGAILFDEILRAVDFYHENCRNNGNLVFSLDAQYFIEKNGGSLLLDNILEMRKGVFNNNDKLVF